MKLPTDPILPGRSRWVYHVHRGPKKPTAKGNGVKVVLAALFIVLVGVIVCRAAQPGEPDPVYQGKALSVWLEGYDRLREPVMVPRPHTGPLPKRVGNNVYSLSMVFFGTTLNPELPHAEEAVRQLGARAVPTLVAMVAASDPPRARQLHRRAVWAFETLGPAGASAFPGLVELFRSPDSEVRACAVDAIRRISTGLNQELVVGVLTNTLGDPDIKVRFATLGALRSMRMQKPELVLPVLIAHLGCTNSWEFSDVCDVLTGLGSQAKPAVPTLLKQVNRPAGEGDAALRALEVIDREAAVKAGITNFNTWTP